MVVERGVAEKEVQKWLDYKKVFQGTREKSSDAIDTITEAIAEGVLILEDDFKFTHKLLIPPTGEKPISELAYFPRLNDIMLRPYLKGVDAGDGDARLTATIAALTGQPKGIISALDTADKKVSMAIATFFF